ncbi:MAG: ParB/RepB/Spo0J family partition protein [Christensenellales bacterium]|jgi:ParB family chromosome partitioning protein
MKAKGLGKGLEALLGEAAAGTPQHEIEMTLIDPNRSQARQTFDEAGIEELAASIRQHGVIQPILLRPENGRYSIIAGERRWRAAHKAGLKTIPALIKDIEERELMEISLIENLQRENLNPVEEAEGLQTLINEYELTQEEAARRLGKSRSYIANSLRLLVLHPEILNKLRTNLISAGHARCLITLPEEQQLRVAKLIVERQLSVRQVEELVKHGNMKVRSEKAADPEIAEAEALLRELLGTKVRLSGNQRRGRIMIEYYSTDELEGILDKLR